MTNLGGAVSTIPMDPRVTLARPDLAAASLEGVVEAERFVAPASHQVAAVITHVRAKPRIDAPMLTQVRLGEIFHVLDVRHGWAWGQGALDGYVGYVEAAALSSDVLEPDRKVAVLRSLVFAKPDLKSHVVNHLTLGARATVQAEEGRFVRVARAGWVIASHLSGLDAIERDWPGVAERFLGAPYYWGGKGSLGLDCSGLVQVALEAAGIAAPRDTDQQEAALGAPVETDPDLPNLARGDLVFWKGHVGIMLDAARLLHASGHHGAVVIEPAVEAVARIHESAGPVTSVRRL